MNETPRHKRLSDPARGIFIAVFIALYSWASKQSDGSMAVALLVGAAVQIAILGMRRIVPPDRMPETIYVIEMIADGITVMSFAIGVLGPIFSLPAGV